MAGPHETEKLAFTRLAKDLATESNTDSFCNLTLRPALRRQDGEAVQQVQKVRSLIQEVRDYARSLPRGLLMRYLLHGEQYEERRYAVEDRQRHYQVTYKNIMNREPTPEIWRAIVEPFVQGSLLAEELFTNLQKREIWEE